MNLLHVIIDVYSIRLISELSVDAVEFIPKIQSYCENINFADRSRYGRLLKKVTHKVGESKINYIKIFQN